MKYRTSLEIREIALKNELSFTQVYDRILTLAAKGYMYFIFEEEISQDAILKLIELGFATSYPWGRSHDRYTTTVSCIS